MSTISTPRELFDRLFVPFDDKLKKTKDRGGRGGSNITFVEWTSYIGRAWKDFPEGFSSEIRSVTTIGSLYKAHNDKGEPIEVDDRQVVVVVRVTDVATGIYHESTGAAPVSKTKVVWGGALPEAESQALRRAFAHFGLGLEMYLDDDAYWAFQGGDDVSPQEDEPEQAEDPDVIPMTEAQVDRLRGLSIILAEHGHDDVIERAREAIAGAHDRKAKAGLVIRKIKAFLKEKNIPIEPADEPTPEPEQDEDPS